MRSVLWNELRAADLMAIAGTDPVVIVPIGSTEQHGPHLPVQVDSLLVSEVARRAAERMAPEPALVTPVLWIGLAEHHMNLGGTVTLDFQTFHAAIRHICLSLTRQGIRRIALLNGHGGNMVGLQVVAGELATEIEGVVAVATYFQLAQQDFAAILTSQDGVRHACEAETSMMLALRPDLVDQAEMKVVEAPAKGLSSDGFHRWRPIDYWSATGVIGSPATATAEKGERLLEAAADVVARNLQERSLWSPPSARPGTGMRQQ